MCSQSDCSICYMYAWYLSHKATQCKQRTLDVYVLYAAWPLSVVYNISNMLLCGGCHMRFTLEHTLEFYSTRHVAACHGMSRQQFTCIFNQGLE